MTKTIKAKFTNGALKPLERIDLEEGQEVSITINGSESNLAYEKWMERYGNVAQEHRKLDSWEDIKKYLHDYRHPERNSEFSE